MENPATWGDVEKIIDAAHREWADAQERGVIGSSFAMLCANRLREAGWINRGEEVPKLISRTLLFALVHNHVDSADGITMNEKARNDAFAWVDRHTEQYDEMGG